jgi:hypothetical protein
MSPASGSLVHLPPSGGSRPLSGGGGTPRGRDDGHASPTPFPLSLQKPTGAAAHLHHERSFSHNDLEGAAAAVRERRHFLPPAMLHGPCRCPRAWAGCAGLLPPARRPIPPSPAQAPHLLSTEEEGRRKTVGPTPDMRGPLPRHRKPPSKPARD